MAASQAALPSASTHFIFRSDLFWTNTKRRVASLQANFDDGYGFVPMSWNAPHAVSYSSAGPKDVRVQVSYTDGTTFESHLVVVAPQPADQLRYSDAADSTFSLVATKGYDGIRDTAVVAIKYGGQNKSTPDAKVLDKPLIVVKGFDVSRIFKILPRFSYKSFANVINNYENRGILSDGADMDGYDIVFVDFNNGTDYIQRNARVLERVIE